MKTYLKLTVFFVVFCTFFGFNLVSLQAEKIEPSRSLKSQSGGPGRLTVFSEPPGQDVKLDGVSVGPAPVRIKSVEPGIHQLQVGKSVTEIYIAPDQTFHISLFRNRFIQFEVASEQGSATAGTDDSSKLERHTSEAPPSRFSTEAKNRDAWYRWMRFVNGTTKHF